MTGAGIVLACVLICGACAALMISVRIGARGITPNKPRPIPPGGGGVSGALSQYKGPPPIGPPC